MREIHEQYPNTFTLAKKGNILLRDKETLDLILDGASNQKIRAAWQPKLDDFLKRRETFLLYPRN